VGVGAGVGVGVGAGTGCAGVELPPQEESANESAASPTIAPLRRMCLPDEVTEALNRMTLPCDEATHADAAGRGLSLDQWAVYVQCD